MPRILLLLITVFFIIKISKAQSKRGNKGVFGDGVVLDFNFSPPSVYPLPYSSIGMFNTHEGSASISDNEGNLLFYTNGANVWNREFLIMPNGSGLQGFDYSTTQTQTVIVPVPKDPFQYYIFTPGYQGRDMVYSLIDMRLDSGRGAVVFKNKLLFEKSTEKVTVIKHASNQSLWLITHEYGTNSFRTYEIDENGIQLNYIISSVGLVHEENTQLVGSYPVYGTNALGYLKPSHDGKYLACAINGELGTLELLQFDRFTGLVSEPIELFRDPSKGSYGVEFSPDNSKLYMTSINEPSLYQFDISSGDPTIMKSSEELISTRGKGALQLGPDGRIYVVPTTNSYSLGRINNPDNSGSNCNYEQDAVDLGLKSVWLGLPELVYNTIEPEVIYYGYCPRSPTTFELINIKDYESIEWDFGDPDSELLNTSTDISPSHIYSKSGYFKIKVKVTFSDNSIFNYTQRISLFDLPELSLGADTTLCDYNSLTLYPETDNNYLLKYNWNDGSTDPFLAVSESGSYWVEVKDEVCASKDTINVIFIPFPEIHLNDTVLCSDETLQVSLPSALNYTWSDGGTGSTRFFNSSGQFSVNGTNQCGTREDEFKLSIIPKLELELPKDSLLCMGQELLINVKNEVAEYRWQDGRTSPHYSVKKDGEYWVEVYNRCETKSDTINIGHVKVKDYFIPNVITPNGDGLNDYFIIDKQLNPANIDILNRWGKLIYTSQQYYDQWNGEGEPSGTYYYMIKDDCTLEKIKGWVKVIK